MARTGFWFQWARGRALARTNAMKRARKIKRAIDSGDISAMRAFLAPEYRYEIAHYHVAECLRHALTLEVKRARACNVEHRKYRKLHIQSGD